MTTHWTLPESPDGQKLSRWVLDGQLHEEEPPEMTVTRVGRWTWHLSLTQACLLVDSWIVWGGVKRVKRLRDRRLAHYVRKLEREKRWREEIEKEFG